MSKFPNSSDFTEEPPNHSKEENDPDLLMLAEEDDVLFLVEEDDQPTALSVALDHQDYQSPFINPVTTTWKVLI